MPITGKARHRRSGTQAGWNRPLQGVFAALTLAGLLAGCADPWVDRRREAGKPYTYVGASTDNRVVVCHAGTTTPEVQQLAAAECARTKRSPVYVGTVRYQCTITAPNQSAFDCR